jgi:cytidine deaminase
MSKKIKNNFYNDLIHLLKKSVAPFSKINVAAIIVTDKGIFKGVNYEDPVFPVGICAERNAIFNGITNGMKKIYEIHIISNIVNISMCGACRQVASSFSIPSTKVFVYTKNKLNSRKVTLFNKLFPNKPILTFGGRK